MAAVDPDVYLDLAAEGGLAAVLERVAADAGTPLAVTPDRWDATRRAGLAASVPDRHPLSVEFSGSGDGRCFRMYGLSMGVTLIEGATSDARDVIRAGVAWGRGASLREMRRLLPFLRSDELAEAHERGPADAVALQWRQMLDDAAARWSYPGYRPLLEAAHAVPELRELYPYSSHWRLVLSACTGFPTAVKAVFLPLEDGRYGVRTTLSPETTVGEADTVEDALALAVSHLPAGLGPAVAGTGVGVQVRSWDGTVEARGKHGVIWGPELAGLDPSAFPMLGHVMPDADTVFNSRQVPTLLEEIARLPPGVVPDESARELRELGRTVLDGQLLLWFSASP
ncbi:DUF6193 family natural product biosynthesis protein [Streptomyces sp. SP18CS02]|uniref:DUF6193 family natural product biosynthesis protein n=1 Tax=Streptomyces sp. SP18CS02 TaxID=3002531 RepID=UPI002E77E6E8|nr:DUF6193 family natural product biosynthesis protein [Streptomyces sp. SP18CS02]MEE1755709.1 DUF6193 family natural product biosynthesis protein [Streptomyces sp. SP18CS02]